MMSVVMAAVQNSSKPSEMGMTTSSVNLIRSIGTTMGTAIFTMHISSRLSEELMEWAPGIFDNLLYDINVIGQIVTYPEYTPRF